MFCSICLGKENAEVIKFLGILKKYEVTLCPAAGYSKLKS